MPAHFHNLQALRGIACLLVLLFHLRGMETLYGISTPGLGVINWFGFAGVDLFFVLSGFLIASTTRKNRSRPAALPAYLFRRAWRIYPTYWVILVIACLSAGIIRVGIAHEPDQYWNSLERLIATWQPFAPTLANNDFLQQAWTLSYELMFYLAFGLLMLIPQRRVGVALGGWACVVGIRFAFPVPAHSLSGMLQSPFVLEFLGGCAIAELMSRGVRGFGRWAIPAGILYAVVGIVLFASTTAEPYLSAISDSRYRVAIFGPAAVLLVYGLTAQEGIWPRHVPSFLLHVGDASYSLYLSHSIVLEIGQWSGLLVSHRRLPHVLWLSSVFAASIAFGLALHAFIERPLLRVGKRILDRTKSFRLWANSSVWAVVGRKLTQS